MKILYIVPQINDEGGVARVLSTKVNYFVEKTGYEVHILTQNKGNSSLFYSFNKQVVLHDMILKGNFMTFFFQYIKALKNIILSVNPDIIIVCDNGIKAYTIPFILNIKKPLLLESHGSRFIEEKEIKKSLFRTIISKIKYSFKNIGARKFDKLIALSNESLQEWDVNNGVVIPNPLWFETDKLADLKSKKVIAVGRHSYEKGLDRLLLIWKKIAQKHPDWCLEIYGKTIGKQDLQTLANNLEISKSIRFFEPITNILEKYSDASIVSMTSRTEGFGMVLIEAMALGLPCIAYDCPVGPRTIIENNANGFLVEEGNSDLFVDKLILLIENENLRIKMGSKAKESSNRYNIDVIMLQWKSLFEDLVKN
jgi:glycosyltransferase involved in cell wall biosynthesis